MESGPCCDWSCKAQNRAASIGDTTVCGCGSQRAGLIEGFGVPNPVQLMLRVYIEPELRILTRNADIVAGGSRRCCGGTVPKAEGLATLERRNPVCRPSSNNRIDRPVRASKEALILADGKFISATEVQHLTDIKVGQSPVKHGTQTRNSRCAVPANASAIQQVTRIRERFGVGVSKKECETVRELLFDLRL